MQPKTTIQGSITYKKPSYHSIGNLYETKDYSLFKPLPGNREPNHGHIKRLVENFKNLYLISPLIVNEHFEVIDGQHRLEAAKELLLPVYFIIINGYGLNEIQIYNSNTTVWKKKDFLDSYCELGLKPYLIFKQFMNDFPELNMTACGMIVLNRSYDHNLRKYDSETKNSVFIKDFEEGRLVINNINLAYKNAKMIMDFKPHYPKGFTRRSFVGAMIIILNNENYDHSLMLKRLKTAGNKMRNQVDGASYIQMLEDIYNYRSSKRVSLKY